MAGCEVVISGTYALACRVPIPPREQFEPPSRITLQVGQAAQFCRREKRGDECSSESIPGQTSELLSLYW